MTGWDTVYSKAIPAGQAITQFAWDVCTMGILGLDHFVYELLQEPCALWGGAEQRGIDPSGFNPEIIDNWQNYACCVNIQSKDCTAYPFLFSQSIYLFANDLPFCCWDNPLNALNTSGAKIFFPPNFL